jgi:outer membrane protein insertion porin family
MRLGPPRAGGRGAAVALACLFALGLARVAPAQEGAPSDAPARVLVALEPLGSLFSDQDEQARAQEWLARFAGELTYPEGPAPAVEVVGRRLVDGSLVGFAAGETGDGRLRALAREAGAGHAVVATVTRLGERYSLDLRVLPADARPMAEHRVLQAQGRDGLAAAFAEASDTVRRALAPAPVEPVTPSADLEAVPDPEAEPAPTPDPALESPAEEPGVAPPAVPARPAAASGAARVAEVRVSGSRRVEPDAVRAVIGTRVGEPFSGERAAEDIRRIYGLGFFRDVQITTSEAPEGVVVTFQVEENPVIRRVTVTGNSHIDGEEIKEKLTLSVGSTVDYPLVLENQARIEELYAQKGFFQTEVSYQLEPLGEDSVAIDFDVREGRELRLVEIDFEGNENLSDGELSSGLQTKRWRWYSWVSRYWDHSGVYAEPVFYQDLDRISRRYMDEGFIRVKLGQPKLEYDDDGLRVAVPVEEGPRYRVGKVEVRAEEGSESEDLTTLLSLREGETFRRTDMTDDVETLRAYYADRGFFFARVEPLTRVDSEDLVVDCAFQVEKGELYFVDRIEVHGNSRTRDEVVRRELSFGEGELFSADALKRSHARVKRLGFFEEVNVEPRPMEGTQRVALDVDVVERATGSFSFGAGYGSTDGFLVQAGIAQENLFGRGYGLTSNANLGAENSSAYVRFANPALLGTALSFTTTASTYELEYDDFDQDSKGLDFSLGYPLDEGDTRGFTGYSWSSRDITGLDVQAASLLQREEFQEDTTTSLVSLSLRRDMRDDPRFPKKGYITGMGLEFAGLGGLSQFIRLEGRTTWWLPLKKYLGFNSTFVFNSRFGWAIPFNSVGDFDLPTCTGADCRALVALGQGEIQPLTTIDSDLELPLTERYFVGGVGAFQVRGFESRSLGPRRAILNQQQFSTAPGDRAFFPVGYSLVDPSGCVYGAGQCNSIYDTDIDDFENLELADVIGGNKFMLVNLEYQFPIAEALGLMGLVFLDMGNAFAENESINPADFRFGTGAGVQWFSPFGPILLTLGFPLDALEDEDATVFEFSLGGSAY